jgi:hypothetical protein
VLSLERDSSLLFSLEVDGHFRQISHSACDQVSRIDGRECENEKEEEEKEELERLTHVSSPFYDSRRVRRVKRAPNEERDAASNEFIGNIN